MITLFSTAMTNALLDFASDVHYPVPDNRQPVFGDRFASVSLPKTNRLAKKICTFPCYPEMTDGDVRQVITAANSWQA